MNLRDAFRDMTPDEMREEASIEVRDIRYFGSQTWPFPSNIMIGFRAEYAGGELKPDDDPFVYHAVHSGWTEVKKHKNDPPHGGVKAAIRNGGWNVYCLEVTEKELIWSVNGAEIDCGDPDQWPFGKPFYFLLDMQLGGEWVGEVDISTLPVKMYIDWIRGYE